MEETKMFKDRNWYVQKIEEMIKAVALGVVGAAFMLLLVSLT
jgi:hypothetical protein